MMLSLGTRPVRPHEDATEGCEKILYSRRHSSSHTNSNILFIRQCWVHIPSACFRYTWRLRPLKTMPDMILQTNAHIVFCDCEQIDTYLTYFWLSLRFVLMILMYIGHFKIFQLLHVKRVFLQPVKVRSWVLEEPATTWSQLWMAAFSSCLGRSPWICYQKGAWNCSTGRQLPKKSQELHAGGLQCLE